MPGLEIKDQDHLKRMIFNRGYDPITRKRWTVKEVFQAANAADRNGIKFEDAMSTPDLKPLLPQTITQVIKEAQEPLLVGPSLLDRVQHEHGQKIVFPAVGALTAADVAEGQSYPEVQPQIGGATVVAEVSKSGIAFSLTEEVLRYSNWDVLGMTLRKAGQALARHKEVKIFKFIGSMGVPTHDNINPTTSIFGSTSGRALNADPNGSAIMDDVFDAYSQVIVQGFVPDTILLHPLTWIMWVKDPVLRSFVLANGGGSFFATWSGNPAGRAPWGNGPQGQLGTATGQDITPGNTVSGDTPNELGDYPQNIDSRPNLPSYFPFPLRIIASPFVPFDPVRRLTDIYIFDSSRLGALIVDEELTTEEWDDRSVETRKIKLRERYGIGIYEEGQAIAAMKNVAIKPNYVTLPAQAQQSVSGNISEIDHSVPISNL